MRYGIRIHGYDGADRRTVERLANGTRASFTYDAADRLTRLSNYKTGSTLLSDFQYSLDNADNRTRVIEASGDRVTWTYDDAYQLKSERRSGANAYFTTFTYDAVGNRLRQNATGSLTTYAYDAANQLQTSKVVAGTTTYTFDSNGNQQIV
jgi:YD repeat-containing protein